ncbi:ATP-binding protein [Streptomyces canus]|uniref:ATP-binding protein n=1 Tax=Streptomyces canus TaxID=58343 RepID=UPI0027853CA5|nr:ATP-binding protein [Streptomyces canus]MDQ0761103.1 anti-sigma regulatory factor (Ser/Thr protein kinase) [Streptomyces canus]MDQ1070272.1 anti-sigma regulatory factor (Ser/Thr protein kinase) [Streptomyces canus]
MPGYEMSEPQLRCVLPFEAVPAEVRLLRKAAAKQLNLWGVSTATDEAELLVTELATNVFKHVGEGVSATLILERRGERLRLEVHDKSQAVPTSKSGGCDEECGRGLHLLAALAVDWGTVLTAVGKAVWCEIAISSGQACRRIERAVEALERYQGRIGGLGLCGGRRDRALEESAIELIADLLHWTAARGHDPDDMLDRAQVHYEAEADAA